MSALGSELNSFKVYEHHPFDSSLLVNQHFMTYVMLLKLSGLPLRPNWVVMASTTFGVQIHDHAFPSRLISTGLDL